MSVRTGKRIQEQFDQLQKRLAISRNIQTQTSKPVIGKPTETKPPSIINKAELDETRKTPKVIKVVKAPKQLAKVKAMKTGSVNKAELDETRTTPQVYTGPKITTKTSATRGKTTGVPKLRIQQYKNPQYKLPEIIQGFYDKSNFPNRVEMESALKEHGLAAKEQFKAKNLNEAYNRAMYAMTETLGGGVRWATLGATGSLGVENRPNGELYQYAGAIATPTFQDMLASWAVGKALQTGPGRALLKKVSWLEGKITAPEKLTEKQLTELRQLTKINDPEYWKTAEGKKLFDQLNKRVTHYLEHPEYYTAGAHVIPEDVYIYQTLDPKVTPSLFDKFMEKYGSIVDGSTKATLALFATSTPKAKDIEAAISKLDENEAKLLASAYQISMPDVSTQEAVLGSAKEKAEEMPDIMPPEEIVIVKGKQKTVPVQESVLSMETPLENVAESTQLETPPLKLSLGEREKRNQLNLRLFYGAKQKWRVTYDGKDTQIIEARGMPDALSQAQRRRHSKTQPNEIVVELVQTRG